MADTVTVTADHRPRRGAHAPRAACLVVLFARDDPDRVGDVAFLGPDAWVLGRGPGRDDDPARRLTWVRQRPGRVEPRHPLAEPGLSRLQLVAQPAGPAWVLENRGRSHLFADGARADDTPVRVGATLRVGDLLVLRLAERPRLLPDAPAVHPFGEPDANGLVGEGERIWELRRRLAWIGQRAGHALLLGESGTGKELAARAVHQGSPRRGRPFVARNSATLPEGLADAELFGHAPGYPQAGMPERRGLVGEADGGTLFLDEIGDLPEASQPRLLRMLDHGEYQRLGETRTRRADLRCVGATNRGIGSLRADLAARFPFRVALPPLRDRVGDVPLLARFLLRRIAAADPDAVDLGAPPRLTAELVDWLARQPLDGNVRELEQLLWRALMRGDAELRPPPGAAHEPGAPADPLDPAHVQAVLDAHNGVQEQAWRALGLPSRHALARLIRRHGLVVRRRPGTG